MWQYLRKGLSVPIVSLEALLTMKREAGRPQDLADIITYSIQRLARSISIS
jgi:hypothetical protein